MSRIVLLGEIAAIASGASLRLWGQATNMDPGLVGLIGNVGVIGVLIWHLWYHTTRSYPEMLRQFSAEQEKSRAAFLQDQQESRSAFLQEQQELRNAFLLEQRELRSHAQRETAELRSMLINTLQAMRVAVHDVKDTAQTAINKQAVAAAMLPKSDPPPGT